jgi:hypothetical protein
MAPHALNSQPQIRKGGRIGDSAESLDNARGVDRRTERAKPKPEANKLEEPPKIAEG